MKNELKPNREGFLISSTHRECTNKQCRKIFKITSKTVTLCPKCNSNRVKSNDPVRKMFFRAKSRSKNKNIDFDIEFSDIKIPEYCPILKIKLECSSGNSGGKNNSPALDRIDNLKGYIKGNVIVISHLANMMKSSANKEQLKEFAKWVNNQFPD